MTQEYIVGFFSRDKKTNADPALFSMRVSYPHRLGGNCITGIPEAAMTYPSRHAAKLEAAQFEMTAFRMLRERRTIRIMTKAQALREYNARKQAAYGLCQKNNTPKKRQKKA